MDKKFLLPTCDIDDSVFCDEIVCDNFKSIDYVTFNKAHTDDTYTQAEREEFLQKLGIDAKDFFKDK